MFSLDNLELDFDDAVTPGKEDALERDRICDRINPNQDGLKGGLIESPKQLLEKKSSPKIRRGSKDTLKFPLATEPKDNGLKRPHLQDEKPQKKRPSHERLLPRKFPGPAGLLPDKPFRHISDLPLPTEKSWDDEEATAEKEKPIIYSQSSGSVFQESAYQKLVTDFSLNMSNNLLNKYTVEWVKKTALSKGLQGRKIPFLGLVVHAVNHNMPDPILMLRDPTGEINGSLHREVWAEMGGKLKTGIAVALRQVGVLITGVIRRQIYLNITMNNILVIYGPSGNEREVEMTTVNKVSQSELLKDFGDWLAASRGAHKPPPSPSTPFTTIDYSWRFSGSEAGMKKSRNLGGGIGEEAVSDLGIEVRDSDFREEMRVPESGARGMETEAVQTLSSAETLIFEEVLNGINLDEFDM